MCRYSHEYLPPNALEHFRKYGNTTRDWAAAYPNAPPAIVSEIHVDHTQQAKTKRKRAESKPVIPAKMPRLNVNDASTELSTVQDRKKSKGKQNSKHNNERADKQAPSSRKRNNSNATSPQRYRKRGRRNTGALQDHSYIPCAHK